MKGRCGTFLGLPLRPEVQAAFAEMDGDDFAYAVCRTPDGQAWEINTRQGNIYSALPAHYLDHDEAMAAGTGWLLAELEREDADKFGEEKADACRKK